VVVDSPATSDGGSFWVFVPAPGRSGEDGVEGFVGVLLRLGTLVDRAVVGLERPGLGLELRERPAGRLLHRLSRTPTGNTARPLTTVGNLTVGDRTYTLIPVASQATIAAERSGESWIVIIAGMLFVAVLQGILLAATARPGTAATAPRETGWRATASIHGR
jgi:hypothetical protein